MMTYIAHNFQVHEYPELDSTNEEAARRADELPDRSVIVAAKQSRGRGQGDNRWESEPGKNITMTILFKPERLPAGEQFSLSMAIALGTRDLVARHVNGCTIKWPNDIYVDDRKIAGILIEHVVMGNFIARSLCGVGLNVNQSRFLSGAPNPVSLAGLTGRELPTRAVMEELLACIDKRYREARDPRAQRRDYLAHLYRGRGVHAWEDANGPFRAAVQGVNAHGQLLLHDERGATRAYNFKEVKPLPREEPRGRSSRRPGPPTT
ncbi:MAG: biotin--[acetyl-CoA-carboxylase] ligase [Odoribacteraceae bacterium]|jgi:BirA family biotin operon repressor/biotin-[acetyl-CoA-carboxylase] ligase|nr:biotin--[acetyl-CoA-carboxylase] ligase [Odoribacteraceae bacterium]